MADRKRIGFIVQKDWKKTHYGVRNYFTTMSDTLAENDFVEYIFYDKQENAESMWYAYSIRKYKSNSLETKKIELENEIFTYSKYVDFNKAQTTNHVKYSQFARCIGTTLGVERYDLLIITNPWLISFDEKLPAKKVVGLVYDLIANEYAITKPTTDFCWAYKHNKGYKYYLKYCDEIYAISEKIAEEFNNCYKTKKCKFLGAFPPYGYKNIQCYENTKENAIILAAPFDLRKGIENIPNIINSVADYVDTLYIYGKPRCATNIFDTFFSKLIVKKIVYYPSISSNDLLTLYLKSKLLLFPSLDEGLGIPLIEAQICGCRVVTTNKAPMNTLALNGGYLLKEKSNDLNIKEILTDQSFDYISLSKQAKEYFSFDTIRQLLSEGNRRDDKNTSA